MKKYATLFLFMAFNTGFAQFGQQPPFTLDLQPATDVSLPGLHSFAFAEYGTKWLFVGGRTNGLHGMSSNDGFPLQYANNNIVVIDTLTWQTYYGSLAALPDTIADPLRSTNMQYHQDGDYLYMIGGFGWDSTQSRYVTFSTLTAIRVDSVVNAVMNAAPVGPHIRQIRDTNLTVCGGELNKLGNDYYLLFGHDFQGRYTDPPTPLFTQEYCNQVKRFTIADDGVNLAVQNYTAFTDTVNYHRRDLNVSPVVLPGGAFALGAYGGVFQYDVNLPYREPITVSSSGVSVNTAYQQAMSHYTCALIPIFDTLYEDMYVTFLGGISLYDYNPVSQTVTLDSLVPFISDITTLARRANGTVEEAVLPLQLSGLLGANAKFIYSSYQWTFPNDVIDFWRLPAQRTHIGYMFGGIRATGTNLLPSSVNDTLYRVYITPDFTISADEKPGDISYLSTFPNPASGQCALSFHLASAREISVEVYDLAGNKIETVYAGMLNKGVQRITWDQQLAQGLYFLILRSEGETHSVKLSVIK
ncbi:MAG: T9SS type A sorting domain-containing protein [Bacteroidota bacterium]